MKKFLLIAVAAVGLLATACTKDETAPVQVDETAVVTFTVEAPTMATRAHGDGLSAENLTVAVYQHGGDKLFEVTEEMVNLKATVEVPFVKGMTYDLVFWAESENSPYTVDWDEKTVGYDANVTLVSNSEDYDAFYAYIDELAVSGPVNQSVTLYRPFAQLNIATNDTEDAAKSGLVVENVAVEVTNAYTQFSLVSGNGVDNTNNGVTFASAPKQGGKILTDYDLLAVNYLFTGGEKQLVNVKFTYTDGDTTTGGDAGRTVEYNSVPVQRNYRTNIVGSLLTSDGQFDVEINPDFNEPDNTVSDKVATAEELLNAVAAGLDNITLTADVTMGEDDVITINNDLILNLNGKTLTTTRPYQRKALKVSAGATLTVKGGAISSTGTNGGPAIFNEGTLIVENATLNGAPYDAEKYNGYDWWPSYAFNNEGGNATFTNTTFNSVHGAVASSGTGAVVTLNNCVINMTGIQGKTSHGMYAYNGGSIVVNGGTYANNDANQGSVGGTLINGNVTVNAGTFTGRFGGTPVLNGGTFSVDPSAYVAAGHIAVDNGNDTWSVVDADAVDSAAALSAALAAGGEVALTADVTADATIVIPEGVEVILHLNGKTIAGALSKDVNGVIKNEGTLTIIGGTVSSTATNGAAAIVNNGTLTVENMTIAGAPSNTSTGYASYAVSSTGAGSELTVTNCNISGRGSIAATNGSKVTINGGTYHSPEVAWGHAVYASGADTEVTINGGTFTEGWTYANDLWGMYQIYAGDGAKVIVNDGDFSQEWDCANGYDLATADKGKIEIKGGVFADDPASQNGVNYVAAGYIAVEQTDSTYKVEPIIKEGVTEIELGDAYPYATIVVDGDITIKGDTEVKTITSTNGGTITIEDGKTLTLNNFSFGSGSNPGKTYKIEGGTVKANYGFFQHGTYELHSDFETGYMYYSFGSNITVYGTFHSKGAGDGLDYVRGNLTIAAGGQSIHDKTLWVGQPASWGAMSASLTIEPGGYVKATTLKVYGGSTLTYTNDVDLDVTPTNEGGTITKL